MGARRGPSLAISGRWTPARSGVQRIRPVPVHRHPGAARPQAGISKGTGRLDRGRQHRKSHRELSLKKVFPSTYRYSRLNVYYRRMAKTSLTKLELQIMEAVWEGGPCSVREIQETFSQSSRPAYTTI